MTEARLYQLLRRHLPMVVWQRIETSTTEGVPDLAGVYQRVQFWAELKCVGGWRVALRPSQVAWHRRWSRAGGLTRIVVHQDTETGGGLWIYPGSAVRSLADHGLRCGLEIAKEWRGHHEWNWTRVLAALTSDEL